MAARHYYLYHEDRLIHVDPGLFSFTTFVPAALHPSLKHLPPGRVGAFTTGRTFGREPAVQLLKPLYHAERLLSHAAFLSLRDAHWRHHQPSFLVGALKERLAHCLQQFDTSHGRDWKFRLLVRSRATLEVWIEPLLDSDVQHEVALRSVVANRPDPELKTTALAASRSARELARAQGADDALLVSETGVVREAAWANFFWVDGHGVVHTSADGILLGITRRILLETHDCVLGTSALDDVVRQSSEAFITNSVSGIVPVTSIDGTPMPTSPGPVTTGLMAWYERAIGTLGEPVALDTTIDPLL
ncbi:MAG: aminotransferase class IV [Bdellovibrionales bacterium]|nr:aminotransferase class IV [Bdellovibrionales bacterium]